MEGIVTTLYATVEREELKRLRKDAERYEWLRDQAATVYVTDAGLKWCWGQSEYGVPDFSLDAAIDAALLAAQGERHE